MSHSEWMEFWRATNLAVGEPGLTRLVTHECSLPTPAVPEAQYIWVCPDCRSSYEWNPVPGYTMREPAGLLGLWFGRTRTVVVPANGFWMCKDRTYRIEFEEQP